MSRNLFIALLLLSTGCMADAVTPVDDPPPVDPPPTTNPPPADTIVPSNNARVRFKGGQRYAAALASGLELAPADVCRELGLYDCVDVHDIALGGIEPYKNGILEPLPATTITTPIAADRIALAACTTRAEADFADLANATVFAGLNVADGVLVDVDDASVEAVIQRLYQRLVTRDATTDEVDALRELYREMATTPSAELAEAWAAVSCYAVASTTEALFY